MTTARRGNVLDLLRTASRLGVVAGLTDGDLLERYVANREEVAYEELLRRHGPMVLGVCRRLLLNPHDVEDAFQATFLVLVHKAAAVRPREKVGHWLFGVAYHVAQKTRAVNARRRARERQVRTLPEPTTVAEGLWDDLRAVLDRELDRLSANDRLPIILCDLEGKTRSEAARQLGWPEGTVAGRLARGRALLARRLTRHGLPVSGGVLAAVLAQNASACVPGSLASATVQAAGVWVSGTAAAVAISAKTVPLTKGVLKTMFLSQFKITTAAVLLAAAVIGGVGWWTHQALAVRQSEPAGPKESGAQSQPEQGKDPERKPDPGSDKAAVELKALEGEWKVVALEADGSKAPVEALTKMRWVIKGSELRSSDSDGAAQDKASIQVDPSKTPRWIDLVPLEGPAKDKTIQGIYKLKKGRLTLCIRDANAATKGRPKEFQTEQKSGLGLITLERVAN